MTPFDLGAQALRLWWVTLAGLLLTAGAIFQAVNVPGVYWGQVDVVFLRPPAAKSPNTLSHSATRVIEAASVIQREVDGVAGPRVVSDAVTLVDQGVTSGFSVRLPNAGGQWANNFNRPYLNVEVSSGTAEGARAELERVLDRIDQALADRQISAGVLPANRLTTLVTPAPEVKYSAGLPRQAAAIVGLLGVGLTGAVLVLAARGVRRKKTHGPPTAPAEAGTAAQAADLVSP